MNSSPWIITTLTLLFSSLALSATPSAESILSKVAKATKSQSESAEVEMKIQKSGKALSRKLEVRRLETSDIRSLIKIHEPSSLKGLGLLSIADKDSEQQWIYLPSTKKSRSILSGNKKSSFLDSHLNYEDLSVDMYRNYNNRVDDSDKEFYKIISTAKSKDASYSKMETLIHKKKFLVSETRYYDDSGKLSKVLKAAAYKKFPGGVWRAQKIQVSIPGSKDYTLMLLKKLDLKKLDPEELSKGALEE